MKTILITGFDPFGQETINPAFEAIRHLPDTFLDARIIKLEVPTQFFKGPNMVLQAVQTYQPDIVICVGQAGGRSQITPELIAINHAHARICDNVKSQPLQQKIKAEGPDAYFSKLPVYEMVNRLLNNEIPACVSYSAGTFVCNTLMYELLYHIDKTNSPIFGGFIHVPFIKQQVLNKASGTPFMSLEDITNALLICIETCLNTN